MKYDDPTADDRARKRCRELLASYEQPAIKSDVADRTNNFVERRNAQLLG